MGGSTTQKSTSTTSPYEPAKAGINSLLSQIQGLIPSAGLNSNETGALDTLSANAQAGNPYAGQIGDLASSLLSGGNATAQSGNIQGALDQYRTQLNPFASGSMVGNNQALQSQLNTVSNDISNRVNSMFAGAGRDFSGANLNSLSRGIMEGTAPILANQYNQDVQNQLNAAGQLYGAGNTTAGLLSGLNQQSLANRQAGIEASTMAQQARDSGANQILNVEAQRRGIPTQNYANLLGTIAPVGQAFGTTNQTTTSSQPIEQQILGGVLGGLGLAGKMGGFGSGGWLLGSGGSGLLGGLGAGAGEGIAALAPMLLGFLSDRRAKEDIEKVGELKDGSNVYSFKYRGEPKTHIGLMADEVEKKTPEAVYDVGGVKMVDYGAATRAAVKRAR